jgi:hypothetical protein
MALQAFFLVASYPLSHESSEPEAGDGFVFLVAASKPVADGFGILFNA